MKDQDVPWELSLRLTERLETPDVRLIYVKDGDHRLSREADLVLLEQTLGALLEHKESGRFLKKAAQKLLFMLGHGRFSDSAHGSA